MITSSLAKFSISASQIRLRGKSPHFYTNDYRWQTETNARASPLRFQPFPDLSLGSFRNATSTLGAKVFAHSSSTRADGPLRTETSNVISFLCVAPRAWALLLGVLWAAETSKPRNSSSQRTDENSGHKVRIRRSYPQYSKELQTRGARY